MSINYLAEARRQHKEEFRMFIANHPGMPRDKIMGLFSYNTGYKKKTLQEWWGELVDAGLIEVKTYAG